MTPEVRKDMIGLSLEAKLAAKMRERKEKQPSVSQLPRTYMNVHQLIYLKWILMTKMNLLLKRLSQPITQQKAIMKTLQIIKLITRKKKLSITTTLLKIHKSLIHSLELVRCKHKQVSFRPQVADELYRTVMRNLHCQNLNVQNITDFG